MKLQNMYKYTVLSIYKHYGSECIRDTMSQWGQEEVKMRLHQNYISLLYIIETICTIYLWSKQQKRITIKCESYLRERDRIPGPVRDGRLPRLHHCSKKIKPYSWLHVLEHHLQSTFITSYVHRLIIVLTFG